MAVIQATNLGFRYPDSPFNLQIEHWEVASGETVALTGPSGCGKTTLFNLLSGILSAQSGQLTVSGTDLTVASEAERRQHRLEKTGLIFQDYPLVDYLDVTQNILLPYRVSGTRIPEHAHQQAQELLCAVGLEGFASRRPHQLSQGERQRVSVCRALIRRPQVLLADEPTSGLDANTSSELIDLLLTVCEAQTSALVVITHDPLVRDRMQNRVDVREWTSK